MNQTTQFRIEQILSSERSFDLSCGRQVMISLTQDTLRQLVNENLVDKDSTVNSKLSPQEILNFGDSLSSFLEQNTELQLRFFGYISHSFDGIHMDICEFEVCHTQPGSVIDCAVEMFPIVSDFVIRCRADKFDITNQRFYAWWD